MGLGLDAFLKHGSDTGARKFLKNWKKSGTITVWLSTRANVAYPSWNHPFMTRGTFEKDGKEIETLRYPRFVSPDVEIVHSSQYFREDNDRLKVPPLLDPFLLLREWLRLECDLPLDEVIFEWENPKNSEITKWTRGELARLVDRGKRWNHSLDTKLEYLFVVVDDANPDDGPQIVRGPKLLGDKMKAAITEQMESNGDDGNPLVKPYAFKWKYDADARSPMDSYKAFRLNKARLTDEIREAITKADFPDPSIDCSPRSGDKAKIRAAMEDAAQVDDLPWERFFVDAWKDVTPEGGTNATDFEFGKNEKTPEVGSNGKGKGKAETKGTGPKQRRRKKKDAPPPEKREPEIEKVQCDDCDMMLLPTEARCPKCGTEYEIDEDTDSGKAATSPTSTGSSSGSKSKDATRNRGDDKCWSCGGKVEGDQCQDCGLEVADDFPY